MLLSQLCVCLIRFLELREGSKFILIKIMQPDVLRRTHIDDFPASQTVDLSSDKFDDLGIILPCKCIPTISIVVFS